MPDRESPLHRLIYLSRLNLSGTKGERRRQFEALLNQSRENNAERDVTGVLMTEDGVVVQVLEGHLDALTETFEAICRDLRHLSLELIDFSPTETREFTDSPMTWLEGWPAGSTIDVKNAPPAEIIETLAKVSLSGKPAYPENAN